MKSKDKHSRRKFLQIATSSLPSLHLVAQGTPALPVASSVRSEVAFHKFSPVDLSAYFNASARDFGSRDRARELGGQSATDGLIRMPSGAQRFRGIPFLLGPEGVANKGWVALSATSHPWSARKVEVSIKKNIGYVCLASFCDWDNNEVPRLGENAIERVGQLLAKVIFVYDNGIEKALHIRRRFEVNSPSVFWGHLSFAAVCHQEDEPNKLTDGLNNAMEWGRLQMGLSDHSYARPTLWLSALGNPEPGLTVESIRFEAASGDPWLLCGMTLFDGHENPFRYERLTLYRITVPEGNAEETGRWGVDVDLGVVARRYVLPEFSPSEWLNAADKGLGQQNPPVLRSRHFYVEVAASSEATLSLRDKKSGRHYDFDLGKVESAGKPAALSSRAGAEVLEREKVWLRGRIIDKSTGQTVAARLAFRSAQGRYIPPYGHRTEVNDGWFEDYGADVKLMDTSFAYVDGTFQVELPVGDVYVEITKGFEYSPLRRRLNIEAGQRELQLELERFTDLRKSGWVTADTHVHFLSPSTAVLEGQAEGVNLINLLAAQWGDMFSNFGDMPHGPLTSRDRQTIVQIGTENRQHILGHLALLGGQKAANPLSAGGPDESYIGDPLWTTMAGWADDCHKNHGLVVGAHFPYPTGEIAADVALGKIDALEIWPSGLYQQITGPFDCLRYLDWYRYLNAGYRLPAVGGTDKMGAYMPVGTNRAYTYLGDEEFSFANWASAVRKGNTFVTSGPLMTFRVDGHLPGEEITLGSGGGTVEVETEVECFVPIHRLEIILNGKVVASKEQEEGARRLSLLEKIRVPGPGWLAARCASRLGPVTKWHFRVSAHTSPVYVRVPGQELFSAPAIAYMLKLVEGSQAWAENLATRPDFENCKRIRRLFAEARDTLHRRLHHHDHSHSHP